MKHNALGFDFPVFDVHLVATEDDGNVLTDTNQITMPVGYVLIGNSRSDVEHDDSTLSCGGKQYFNTETKTLHARVGHMAKC